MLFEERREGSEGRRFCILLRTPQLRQIDGNIWKWHSAHCERAVEGDTDEKVRMFVTSHSLSLCVCVCVIRKLAISLSLTLCDFSLPPSFSTHHTLV